MIENKPLITRVEHPADAPTGIVLERLLQYLGLGVERVDPRNGYPPDYRIVKDGEPQG